MSRQAERVLLRSHGLRATEIRLRVLEVLLHANGHLSVSDIHEKVSGEGDTPVDVSTLYRTVTTLGGLGLVHSMALPDQPVTYGLVDVPHHHVVCTSCHTVMEVPATALDEAMRILQDATGYSLGAHGSVQVHGLCADCRAAVDA